MTTVTPPPPPAAPYVPAPPPQRSSAAAVVSVTAIVIGALVIAGLVLSAVFSAVTSASIQSSTRTLPVAGVSELDARMSAGSLRVEFADVREAELRVTGPHGADRWQFDTSGDRLVVRPPDRFWLVDGLFGSRPVAAVLVLPQSLSGLDATLGLSAGEIVADGEFGQLALNINAGSLEVTGSAETVSVDISAGRGILVLDDVTTAAFGVSAGDIEARLFGTQPEQITVDVSAGSVDLLVPEGRYDVSSDVSAGGFDNRLGSQPGASSTIRVDIAAGSVLLRH